jgi:hypothetical protein
VKENYKLALEVNFAEMTLEGFAEYYNKNIPASFPRATKEALKQFQTTFPNLFAESKTWTIDKHRRRLMDWLPSYHEAT